jgi:hypothetical protein
MLLLISYWNMKPQGVGSSGKDLGLCGSPMRSKVNPLGQPAGEAGVLLDSYGGGVLPDPYEAAVRYLFWLSFTMKGSLYLFSSI